MALSTFAQLSLLHQLHPFLDQQALLTVSHTCPSPFQSKLCNVLYMGLSLQSIWKLRFTVLWQFCALQNSTCYTSILQYWLPGYSQVQFKVLVLIFAVLRCMGLDYLRDPLSPVTSSLPTRSVRKGMLWAPSVKHVHLVNPRRWAFSAVELSLWNILSPEN